MMKAIETTTAVILAGGQGTRMKNSTPKVLTELLGKPLLFHVFDNLKDLGIGKVICVLSEKTWQVIQESPRILNQFEELKSEIGIVIQNEAKGTADALASALVGLNEEGLKKPPYLNAKIVFGRKIEENTSFILCLNGDGPLLAKEDLAGFFGFAEEITKNKKNLASFLALTAIDLSNPYGYGRVVLSKNKKMVMQIIEEKEASLRQRQIQICSSGVYLANKEFLFELLAKVKPNNLKKEYYLTDIVQEAARLKKHAKAYVANNPQSFLGINDLAELSQVEEILLKRIKTAHMKNGVRLIMPETIYIEPSVKIAEDCVIEPHVCLFGKTQISSGKRIKAFSCLKDQKV